MESITMDLSKIFKSGFAWKIFISVSLFIFYIAVFKYSFYCFGEVTTMLILIPVCVSAWMWGLKKGLIFSLLPIPINGLMFKSIGLLEQKNFVDGIPAFIITILLSTAIAKLSDLNRKYKALAYDNLNKQKELELEIKQKNKFESELKKINANLGDLVNERTKQLLEAKNRAEESDRLKSEFLAQISHEIRSPINTILNYVSLIRTLTQDNKDEDLQYSFVAIDSSTRRLIRTIDLILNVSQLQTGKYECKFRNINLEEEILIPLVNEMQSSAKAKGLKLNYLQNGNAPNINGDEYTLTQVFANLIDNAIKYTQHGEINIKLIANNNITASVSDTGIGISEEFLQHLFEPFVQEEQGYTRRYEGSGLGLTLVDGYCKLNNAQIKVESRKGSGSTFKVIFQLN